jgi:hypothetical protein
MLEELMAKALETWPREVIEEALGADADTVLPEADRLVELRARIPRYQLAMLQHLADQQQTTMSHVLTRKLEDLASAHAENSRALCPGSARGSGSERVRAGPGRSSPQWSTSGNGLLASARLRDHGRGGLGAGPRPRQHFSRRWDGHFCSVNPPT